MDNIVIFENVWADFCKQAAERSHMDRIALAGNPARLGYLALGLCGEAAEAVEAMSSSKSTRDDILSELGDVAWYLAMVSNEARVAVLWYRDGQQRHAFNTVARVFLRDACAVAECIKRPMCGRELNYEKLSSSMGYVAFGLSKLARIASVSMPEALAANIAKNHARFGTEGYTVERQRVLDAAQGGGDRG